MLPLAELQSAATDVAASTTFLDSPHSDAKFFMSSPVEIFKSRVLILTCSSDAVHTVRKDEIKDAKKRLTLLYLMLPPPFEEINIVQ